VKLVIGFDLDMTLLDTRAGIAATYRELSARTGVPIDADLAVTRLGPPLRVELANWFPAAQIEDAAQAVVRWLDEGERVYVHCRAGWQRSATVVAAIVALREDINIAQALQVLRERKPTANPLMHQRADLLDWWLLRTRGA
jgi:phosphoglycolate phosphatase-like HAD superfamily hydrolase